MVWMGFRPLFSASAIGMTSRASANDLMAYCSRVGHYREKKDKTEYQGRD